MNLKKNICTRIRSTNWRGLALWLLPIAVFLLVTTIAPGTAPPNGGGGSSGGAGPGT